MSIRYPVRLALNPGCAKCNKWRSRAFDGLTYLAWHAKAENWDAAGRKQRFCENCRKYQWERGKP